VVVVVVVLLLRGSNHSNKNETGREDEVCFFKDLLQGVNGHGPKIVESSTAGQHWR